MREQLPHAASGSQVLAAQQAQAVPRARVLWSVLWDP